MSLRLKSRSSQAARFPRVSGDEPPVGGGYWARRTFSPRERG